MQNTFLAIFILLFTIQPPKTETFEAVTVLELFTSQGCSSCPLADELLGNVKDRVEDNSIIALSYHVDYWNYIGWKDPFSSKANTQKQRAYGEKFFSNRIYTPQLVVNGKEHFVGSNAKTLDNKLKAYKKQLATNKVSLSNVKTDDNTISFNYEVEGDIDNKSIRFVLVIDERITQVKRGENRNRTIKNENIVVTETLKKIKSTSGASSLTIPSVVDDNDALRVVAIIWIVFF